MERGEGGRVFEEKKRRGYCVYERELVVERKGLGGGFGGGGGCFEVDVDEGVEVDVCNEAFGSRKIIAKV